MSRKSIYLISPRPSQFNYYALDVMGAHGYKRATLFGDLSVVTLAAMADEHLDVEICDQAIQDVNFDHPADYIGITGKITQAEQMFEIARRFRDLGKTVLIGGPFASLSAEKVRPHCDVLVRGEIEGIADDLFAELAAGKPKDEYVGGQPDISTSPVPRWDLYKNARAMGAAVQTSRGCPFECEFCDVIVFNGRKQRHKKPSQVLAELDAVYALGHRGVLLADDNLTVYRQRAKELLEALVDWNRKQTAGHMRFSTQLSIDVARDEELLRLAAEAGVSTFFIGLETPNLESLKGAKKRQNVQRSLVDDINKIFSYGIMVRGGMIVGFDHDGPDIFERQLEFATQSAVPIFSLGALMAPDSTPLQGRLAAAGRLKADGLGASGDPFHTNIVHPNLADDELLGGLSWLVSTMYDPEVFGDRLLDCLNRLGPRLDPDARAPIRFVDTRRILREAVQMVNRIGELGPGEQSLWDRVLPVAEARHDLVPFIYESMFSYMQVRHMVRQALSGAETRAVGT